MLVPWRVYVDNHEDGLSFLGKGIPTHLHFPRCYVQRGSSEKKRSFKRPYPHMGKIRWDPLNTSFKQVEMKTSIK